MTREQNFRTSFITQLASLTGWQHVVHCDLKKIPISEFPSFTLDLGKTTYKTFDPSGKAISGEQEFTVSVYYCLPVITSDNAYLSHSDMTNIIEQFANDPLYSPPAVIPGETYRIERTILGTVSAPAIRPGDARFQVMLNGKYLFTIF